MFVEGDSACLAAVLVMPETLARLEGLAAAPTHVRTHVRVDALVRPHGCRVLEALAAHAALLTQLRAVFEQLVLLQVVPAAHDRGR